MQKTKRQHTVPRCYLERFVKPETGNIPTFDKIAKRAYETSVWNVAQERFFYDIHPESVAPEHRAGFDPQVFEKGLAAIEGYFARALDDLLAGSPKGVHPDLRWMLAVQAAIQWMRTRRYRDTMVELSEKFMQAQADELVRRNFPDLPRDEYPRVTLEEHGHSVLHTHFLCPSTPPTTRSCAGRTSPTTRPAASASTPLASNSSCRCRHNMAS
jgi:hypothetical protein